MLKTKPFNLEAALKGAKVVTRGGIKVTRVWIDDDAPGYPIRADRDDGKDYHYTLSGSFYKQRHDDDDLFLLDESSTRYTEGKTYTLPFSLHDSLEITHDMWRDLQENPGKTKEEWLKEHPNIPKLAGHCACCSFAGYDNDESSVIIKPSNCNKCPLLNLWPNYCNGRDNSPWLRWNKDRNNTAAAKQIADAAEEELRRLDKKERVIVGVDVAQGKDTTVYSTWTPTPKDPFAELKQAHKEGRMQIRVGSRDGKNVWQDWKGYSPHAEPAWDADISIYRIKPTPRYRPWKAEEVPVGKWIRCKGQVNHHTTIYGVSRHGLFSCEEDPRDIFDTFQNALDNSECSIDNGKTWLPCGVLVEE